MKAAIREAGVATFHLTCHARKEAVDKYKALVLRGLGDFPGLVMCGEDGKVLGLARADVLSSLEEDCTVATELTTADLHYMLTWSPAVNNFKSKAFTKRCCLRKHALQSLGQSGLSELYAQLESLGSVQ